MAAREGQVNNPSVKREMRKGHDALLEWIEGKMYKPAYDSLIHLPVGIMEWLNRRKPVWNFVLQVAHAPCCPIDACNCVNVDDGQLCRMQGAINDIMNWFNIAQNIASLRVTNHDLAHMLFIDARTRYTKVPTALCNQEMSVLWHLWRLARSWQPPEWVKHNESW